MRDECEKTWRGGSHPPAGAPISREKRELTEGRAGPAFLFFGIPLLSFRILTKANPSLNTCQRSHHSRGHSSGGNTAGSERVHNHEQRGAPVYGTNFFPLSGGAAAFVRGGRPWAVWRPCLPPGHTRRMPPLLRKGPIRRLPTSSYSYPLFLEAMPDQLDTTGFPSAGRGQPPFRRIWASAFMSVDGICRPRPFITRRRLSAPRPLVAQSQYHSGNDHQRPFRSDAITRASSRAKLRTTQCPQPYGYIHPKSL